MEREFENEVARTVARRWREERTFVNQESAKGMEILRRVEIEPIFVETMPSVFEENTIYISEKYGVAVHACLRGCSNLAIMPLSGGPYWELVKEEKHIVSFIGSVCNYNFPYKPHYLIFRNVANFF